MNWKTLFARDSWLWRIFFYGGVLVMAVSAAPQSIIDSFPKWVNDQMPVIRFLAFIASVLGGKLGMSLVPLQRNMENGGTK